MEPIFEYFEIIVNRLQNPLPKGEYGERHHIYPKSCGGWDLKCNLVKLTPEEHYRCHELLPEIFKDEPENYGKMVYAWHFISISRDGLKISSDEYGKIRKELHLCGRSEEYRRKISESKMGEKNGMFGKKLSEEHKQKLRNSTGFKGRKHTEESRKKMSDSLKGRTVWNKGKKNCYSEETLLKMSKASTGRKQSKETIEKRTAKLRGHPNWGPKIPWNKGKTMSAEYRKKLSEAHKGKKPSKETLKKRGAAIKAALERKRQCKLQSQSQS